MRIVRFSAQGKIRYGILTDKVIKELQGSPFSQRGRTGDSPKTSGNIFKLDKVKLLAPCLPSKIVCIGLNYKKHAEEAKQPIPSLPLLFLKPSTAVIGPDDTIIMPRDWKRVDYEGELGIVIGKKAKDVPEAKINEYILGYTCFNDVSERHAQIGDGQWTRGKGYDTFAPMGPWIETDVNPNNLKIETYLNGKVHQSGNTNDLIFGIPRLITFISAVMTLLPGDVIATGTPAGIGPMNPGDVVEVKIEKIGTLRNILAEQK